jgi:hypothetical protein
MKQVVVSTPQKQMAAGFWVACGAIAALVLAFVFFSAAKGEANPHKVYYPLCSKAPTEEARREFRAWSVSGLLHYHYERSCQAIRPLERQHVGSGVALGNPKRQSFDGYEMDPCPLCVERKK